MAFVNEYGEKISFDCGDLIDELAADIKEFGGNKMVNVVTEQVKGVTLYKDYALYEPGDNRNSLKEPMGLIDSEDIKVMTMTALMELYRIENEIM